MLLFTGMFLCYAHRGALAVAAPFLIKDMHLSPKFTGVLLSVFFWSYALMQVPAGWLVDRRGPRRVYSDGMALGGLAMVLTGFTSGLAGLIPARMLLGVGQSVAFPATSRAVAEWFPQAERGTVSGIYLSGVRMGQAGVTLLGAWMLQQYSWQLFFGLTGLAAFLWLWPWNRFLRPWEQPQTAAQAQAVPFLKSLGLLRQPSLLGIFLAFSAHNYVWNVYLNWLPSYLVLERKFTPAEMGLYGSMPYVLMSGVILLSGLFSDALIRRGYREMVVRKSLVITGLAISCLAVPAGAVEDRHLSVLLITLSLCGLGVSSPNIWALTQAVCAKRIVGTASGIQNFGGNLAALLAPLLTGYIADQTHSFAMAMAVMGGISVAGLLACLLLVSKPVEA